MSGTTTKPRGNARPTHLPSRTPSRCGRAFSGENHRKCGLALLVVCTVLDIGTGSQLHGHGPDKIQPSPRIPNLCRWRKLEATQPPASRVPVSHISGHASVTGPYSRPRDASPPAAAVTERGSAAEALRLEPSSQPPYPLFSLSLSLPPTTTTPTLAALSTIPPRTPHRPPRCATDQNHRTDLRRERHSPNQPCRNPHSPALPLLLAAEPLLPMRSGEPV